MPGRGDIKDGLLKMIIYSNLATVEVDGTSLESIPILKLTSNKIKFDLSSAHSSDLFESWCKKHTLRKNDKAKLIRLFAEARANNFVVSIENQ